jgi:hypothetical protein
VLQTIRRLLIRPGRFRLERELPGGICTHDICAPWQGTQWNKIEPRLFCHTTENWRGTPLTSHLAVVELIATTTTKTGLTVRYEADTRTYPKGIKVSEEEMASLNIKGDAFHPEWNYTISPRPPWRGNCWASPKQPWRFAAATRQRVRPVAPDGTAWTIWAQLGSRLGPHQVRYCP